MNAETANLSSVASAPCRCPFFLFLPPTILHLDTSTEDAHAVAAFPLPLSVALCISFVLSPFLRGADWRRIITDSVQHHQLSLCLLRVSVSAFGQNITPQTTQTFSRTAHTTALKLGISSACLLVRSACTFPPGSRLLIPHSVFSSAFGTFLVLSVLSPTFLPIYQSQPPCPTTRLPQALPCLRRRPLAPRPFRQATKMALAPCHRLSASLSRVTNPSHRQPAAAGVPLRSLTSGRCTWEDSIPGLLRTS